MFVWTKLLWRRVGAANLSLFLAFAFETRPVLSIWIALLASIEMDIGVGCSNKYL